MNYRCLKICLNHYFAFQDFLRNVNELWQTMHQEPGLHPINWVTFPSREELLTAYWLEPSDIEIAVVFEPPGPIYGPLKYVHKFH